MSENQFVAGNPAPVPFSSAGNLDYPEYKGPFAFFRRHYNGDYSLARSYWVNTFLVSAFAPVMALLLLPFIGDNTQARYGAMAFLFVTTLGVVLWCWAVAGTWASANKHVGRGGKSGWATAAKAIIVFGALRTLVDLAALLPTIKEMSHVATGAQLGPETTLMVSPNGRSILLSGGINDGNAEQLDAALEAAPAVTTVVLDSGGGWIREGELLAEVIRKRGLSTYVSGYCASACTIPFLAGKERIVAPAGQIGFHAGRNVGSMATKPNPEENAQLRAIYRRAGLPDSFVAQVVETPHDGMWHPSHDELLSAGVLTRKAWAWKGP